MTWRELLVAIVLGSIFGVLLVLGFDRLTGQGEGAEGGRPPAGVSVAASTRWPRHYDLAWARRHGELSRLGWYHDCDFQTVAWEHLRARTFLEPVVVRGRLRASDFRETIEDLQGRDPDFQRGSVKAFAKEGPQNHKQMREFSSLEEARAFSRMPFSEFLSSSNSTLFETIHRVERDDEGRPRTTVDALRLPRTFSRHMQEYFQGSFQVQILAATQRQGFTPHVHGEAFFMHVWGPKRWRVNKQKSWPLFVNERTGLLNTGNFTADTFVNRPGTSECTLRPGDLLYLPHYYPHTIENFDNITLGFQTMGSSPYLQADLINTPGYFLHK